MGILFDPKGMLVVDPACPNDVIGKYALKGSNSPNDLKEDTTRDNRDRLIEFCYEHDLKLENTMFDKPTNKLVTFKPTFIPHTEKLANTNTGKQTT